jgi:hypothetical protein
MAFHITFEPINRIQGVKPRTVTKETAAEAWAEVQGLQASDERTSVKDDSGRHVEDWQLRELAAKERN